MSETSFRTARQPIASEARFPEVRALSRGLRLLEILAAAPHGLSLTHIAQQAELSKSSAHRLVQTLVNSGYLLQKQKNGHYFPSLKVLTLSHKLIEDTDLRAVSRPHLSALAEVTGETAHLVFLDHDAIVYVDKVESSNPIRMYSRIGRRAPPHCTGVGKAILAYLPQDRLAEVLGSDPLERYTNTTITNRGDLQAHLAEILSVGYAIDDGEHEEQVRCLASPLFAANGDVVGALSISAVSYRVDMPKLLTWWPTLREQSQALSADLAPYFDRYT